MFKMFGNKKKKCGSCGKGLNGNYSYCPYCGGDLLKKKGKGDWGLLGKEDSLGADPDNFQEPNLVLPRGFNMIFNSLMKNLDKQIKKTQKEMSQEQEKNVLENMGAKKKGFSINISSGTGNPPKIKVQSFGIPKELLENQLRGLGLNPTASAPSKKTNKIAPGKKLNMFSIDKQKEFSGLKKEEPKVNVRRLADRVVYEIEMPEVKDEKNISIVKLEEGIEVKAIGKKLAYSKTINVNFPVLDYNFSKKEGVLELELAAE